VLQACFSLPWYHGNKHTYMLHLHANVHKGRIVAALRAEGMFDNTLIICASDNGGPVYLNGTAGANNHPLKGGKASNWEGGIRVNAFVSAFVFFP